MDKNQFSTTIEWRQFLLDVKEQVRTAQYSALKTVNFELVGLYWDIGKMIVERQNNADHNAAIVKRPAGRISRYRWIFTTKSILYAGVISHLSRR